MSSPLKPFAAAILNGGKAHRMGGVDKAQICVEGRRIAETQLALLREYTTSVAMVVAREEQSRGLGGVQPLFDRVGGLGPLDGIASALAWSPHPWLLILACDMPAVQPEVINLLLAARGDITSPDIVAPRAHGRVQPTLALYHRRLLPALDTLLGASKLRASALLESPPPGVSVLLLAEEEVRRADPKLESFRNLNSPDDLPPAR